MANFNPPTNGFDKRPQDINKGGRPPEYFGAILRMIGEQVEPQSGKPFKELVSKRMWLDAVNGNTAAQKELMNRLDGLPSQTLDMNFKGNVKIDIDGIIGLRKTTDKTADSTSDTIQPKV